MTLDAQMPQGDRTLAFAQLAVPPERIIAQEIGRAKLLPACCGTYAFHGRAGELLYIGKAKNVRARVLSHFRADLVGRLRPPLNRQMRSWSRYCYLLPTDDRANPLSISCQLQSWRRCFGPFRTRRQAVRIVEAVFRLVACNGDAETLAKCYRLLAGEDDSLVVKLERHCQGMADDQHDEPWTRVLPQVAEVLAKAFERAVLLRAAERMLGGIMVLPGRAEPRRVAVITHSRLHLNAVQPDMRDADAFLASYRKWIADEHTGGFHSLPKSIADCLCVAARETTRCAGTCRFVSAEKAGTLSAGGLIAMRYEEAAAGSVES